MKKSPRAAVSFEDFRRVAASLRDVEEGTAWGFPVFRVSDKIFLAHRTDLDSIVVMTSSFEQRDEMIREDPETYYITDHHRPKPWVLARLSKLRADIVEDLVRMGWRSGGWNSGAKKKRRAPPKAARRSRS